MSAAVILEIQRVQAAVHSMLDGGDGKTFAEFFAACGLKEGANVNGTSHDRILDRALRGLRQHGDIRFNRVKRVWELVEEDPP
jgi:hypothetical protein